MHAPPPLPRLELTLFVLRGLHVPIKAALRDGGAEAADGALGLYIYTYIHIYLSIYPSRYICYISAKPGIYMCMYICIFVHMYI